MRTRLALAAALAVSMSGVLSATAGADPTATICGSAQVTVNGQSVIDQSQCQVLPPQS